MPLTSELTSKGIRDVLEMYSGVFDDVCNTQLEGWGASNFLVHFSPKPFQIVAEFRSGSGSMYDCDYATHALRTWHILAAEVLELRERLEKSDGQDGKTNEG